MNKYRKVVLVGAVLFSAACMCTGFLPDSLDVIGGKETLPLTQTQDNEAGGFSVDLPEEWASQNLFYMTLAAESEEALASEEVTGPVLLVMVGPADEMSEGASSPEDMLSAATADEFTSDLEMGDIKTLDVSGVDGAAADLSGTDPETGDDVAGRIVTLLSDTHAGFIISLAPVDTWEEFSPTFDEIIQTLSFFEPDPEAGFGDFGGDGDFAGDSADEVEEPASGGAPMSGGDFTLVPGDVKTVTMADGEVHDWTFEGAAGQVVSITVQPVSDDMDLTLSLTGPDGTVIVDALDDGWSGEAESIFETLSAAGTYTVHVEPFGYGGGDYIITLQGEGGQDSSGSGGDTSGGSDTASSDGTTIVEFTNQTQAPVCYMFMVPTENPSWGSDNLDWTDIVPGGSHTKSGMKSGVYDIKLEDCDRNLVAWNLGIEIPPSSEAIEAPIEVPAHTVTFNNDLDEDVCVVHMTRDEDLADGWRRNLLSDDEAIAAGSSRWFKAGEGSWGFKIETCGGYIIEVTGINVSGKMTFNLSDW